MCRTGRARLPESAACRDALQTERISPHHAGRRQETVATATATTPRHVCRPPDCFPEMAALSSIRQTAAEVHASRRPQESCRHWRQGIAESAEAEVACRRKQCGRAKGGALCLVKRGRLLAVRYFTTAPPCAMRALISASKKMEGASGAARLDFTATPLPLHAYQPAAARVTLDLLSPPPLLEAGRGRLMP